jgi:amidase
MSVFSLEYSKSNPVTIETLHEVSRALGVSLKKEEEDEYQRLLAVFHESVESLMGLPGTTFPKQKYSISTPKTNIS